MVACITRNPGTMLVAAPDLGHETICHLSIISGHQCPQSWQQSTNLAPHVVSCVLYNFLQFLQCHTLRQVV